MFLIEEMKYDAVGFFFFLQFVMFFGGRRMPAIMMADPGQLGGRHPDPHHLYHQQQQQQQHHQEYSPEYNNQQQAEYARKMADLETLRHIIGQWNANRLDLFELSMPNEVGPYFLATYFIFFSCN